MVLGGIFVLNSQLTATRATKMRQTDFCDKRIKEKHENSNLSNGS